MTGLLAEISSRAVDAFAVASMAAVGLRYSIHEILRPLRSAAGVALVLGANFVAVPLLAIGILQIVPLDRPYAIGLVLVALAAGAPFTIKLTQMSGGDVAFSAGVLVLLIVLSIGVVPLVAPRLAPGVTISAWGVAAPLIRTMLLPLVLGMGVRAFASRATPALLRLLGPIANVALAVLVLLIFGRNVTAVAGMFGTGAIAASVLLIAGAFAIGWVSGGLGERLNDEVGFCTAQRNYAAALVVASDAFASPDIVLMVVVVSLISMAMLFPAASFQNRWLA
jgi:BASS family bile acid:Na+ symporter